VDREASINTSINNKTYQRQDGNKDKYSLPHISFTIQVFQFLRCLLLTICIIAWYSECRLRVFKHI
jgi:hypothetical protein